MQDSLQIDDGLGGKLPTKPPPPPPTRRRRITVARLNGFQRFVLRLIRVL